VLAAWAGVEAPTPAARAATAVSMNGMMTFIGSP
jgi:hypothetical protein